MPPPRTRRRPVPAPPCGPGARRAHADTARPSGRVANTADKAAGRQGIGGRGRGPHAVRWGVARRGTAPVTIDDTRRGACAAHYLIAPPVAKRPAGARCSFRRG
ncbi:hypothetical protein GCM10009564_45880 [Streptomyces thermogriseus]|uniref:Uncharacterized protein n=1 Tax=Streptomyces thermogriseus TaxID=75292 RepID=A0ABP4DMD2_9ACTN